MNRAYIVSGYQDIHGSRRLLAIAIMKARIGSIYLRCVYIHVFVFMGCKRVWVFINIEVECVKDERIELRVG